MKQRTARQRKYGSVTTNLANQTKSAVMLACRSVRIVNRFCKRERYGILSYHSRLPDQVFVFPVWTY